MVGVGLAGAVGRLNQRPGRANPSPAPVRWRFESRIVRRTPEELRRREVRLREALRIGHALGCRFELRWVPGPAPRVELAAPDPGSARWAGRLLLAGYEAGQWVRAVDPGRTRPRARVVRRAALRTGGGLPLPATDPAPWSDGLVEALRILPFGPEIVLSAVPAGPAPPPRRPRPPGVEAAVVPVGGRLAPLTDTERELRDRIDARALEPVWRVTIHVEAARAMSDSCIAAAVRVAEAAARQPGTDGFVFRRPWPILGSAYADLPLRESELLGALPGPSVQFVAAPVRPTTDAIALALGTSRHGEALTLPLERRQGRHLAIVGETGMGKSSLLIRVALAASQVGNVALFDPVGDTGLRLLACLPVAARSRVVLIAPRESPVAVNALAAVGPDRGAVNAERGLGDLVDALRRVRAARYADTPFWGPRIEEMVRRALAAAAATPGGTIVDAEALLGASRQRPGAVFPSARPAVEELRQRVLERPEEVDGARRLLFEITGRTVLRQLLCAREPRWSVRQLTGGRRITLFLGEAPVVGESTARYLLSVHLALAASELLGRDGSEKTFLLLDEAQWYAHDAVAEMLRLGRRANLHLVLATQALAALPEAVREATLTNVADFVVFRGAPEEAREFARWHPSLSPEMMLGLPRGEALALIGKGGRIDWLRTSPPPPAAAEGDALNAARESSRPYVVAPEEEDPAAAGPTTTNAPASPTPAPILSPAGERAGPGTARGVLLTLWAGFLESDLPTLEVALSDLRAEVDRAGDAVREAGSRLGRAGAFDDAGHGNAGRWAIRREALAGLLGPSVDPAELAWASARWAAVRTRVALARPEKPS